jgi:hypothetical protein
MRIGCAAKAIQDEYGHWRWQIGLAIHGGGADSTGHAVIEIYS